MAVPVNNRQHTQVTEGLAQTGEVFADSGETVPYPQGHVLTPDGATWPPPGFDIYLYQEVEITEEANMGNYGTGSADQTPDMFDLRFVQGDSLVTDFVFEDVLWLPEDPGIEDETAPEWVEAEWASQIRNPYLTSSYSVDRWVPMNGSQYVWWRSNSWIADIDATAEAIEVEDSDPLRWATKVRLRLPADRSRAILPGSQYRWDLQVRLPNEDAESKEDDDVFTQISGRVSVLTQWTTS